eukprot:jgi/Ulvmu1/12064/UM083_0077.1
MSEILLNIDDTDRLDIHFALGSELLIVNAGARDVSCHAIDWASTSPLTRHATLLVVNGPSTVHHAPPIGLVNVANQNVSASAQAISQALNTVADAEMWTGNDDGMPELADVHLEGAQNNAAVWDLISLLMFLQHDPSGYMSEELVQWAVKHSEPLSAGLSGSLYEQFPALLESAQDRGFSVAADVTDRSCWILLQQLLAIGDSERALQLLNAHIEVEEESLLGPEETAVRYILQQLALLIKAAPRYTQSIWESFEDFQSARKQWVSSVTLLSDELPAVLDREFEGACPSAVLAELQEVLTLLMASMGEGPEAALWRVTPSALHFFIATLLHVQPTQPLGPSLAETLSICIQLKIEDSPAPADSPPLHKIVMEVIKAACAGEPLRVLRAALMPALQGSWVAAHAAALMSQDSRYADLLGMEKPSEMDEGWLPDDRVGVPHHRMGIAEFLMLDAMAPLATGSARMWAPLATALTACRVTGRAATQALAERWNCSPAEVDSLQLHLRATGLSASADALGRRAAMDALHRGHIGQAFELASPTDPWMRDALAPYANAAVLRHAASSVELSAPAPELAFLGGLLEAMVPQTDAAPAFAEGAGPAGSDGERALEGAAAYVRLCRACARLQDFTRGRRGASKFDALGVGGLRTLQSAVRQAAMAVITRAPPPLALQCMHKLRPMLRGSGGMFTAENLEELVMRLQGLCAHDGPAAQLAPADEAALRHDLLTASVLISAID